MYMWLIGGVATAVTNILDPLLCGDSCIASSPSHALFFNVKDEARDTVAREPFVHQHYYLGELANCMLYRTIHVCALILSLYLYNIWY